MQKHKFVLVDEAFQPHERERIWASHHARIIAQRVTIAVAVPGEITSSDEHVIIDAVARIQRSWVDRNTRLRKPGGHVVDDFPTQISLGQ